MPSARSVISAETHHSSAAHHLGLRATLVQPPSARLRAAIFSTTTSACRIRNWRQPPARPTHYVLADFIGNAADLPPQARISADCLHERVIRGRSRAACRRFDRELSRAGLWTARSTLGFAHRRTRTRSPCTWVRFASHFHAAQAMNDSRRWCSARSSPDGSTCPRGHRCRLSRSGVPLIRMLGNAWLQRRSTPPWTLGRDRVGNSIGRVREAIFAGLLSSRDAIHALRPQTGDDDII